MLSWAFWFLAYRCVRSRPSRIPLSAFIVEDMAELARAHATYRFVILDEEEERPRILVRTFSLIRSLRKFPAPDIALPSLQDVALQTEHASILQG